MRGRATPPFTGECSALGVRSPSPPQSLFAPPLPPQFIPLPSTLSSHPLPMSRCTLADSLCTSVAAFPYANGPFLALGRALASALSQSRQVRAELDRLRVLPPNHPLIVEDVWLGAAFWRHVGSSLPVHTFSLSNLWNQVTTLHSCMVWSYGVYTAALIFIVRIEYSCTVSCSCIYPSPNPSSRP